MALHESAEMYLETIYQLAQQKGTVRSMDIVEAMGYSKASISRAVGLLKKNGYLLSDESGFLTLTETGRQVAQKVYERHTVLTQALMALGVDREIAAEDACKIEHTISDETFAALKKYMKDRLK